MKNITLKIIFILFITAALSSLSASIVSASETCSEPAPEPIISNCNFQPKLSPNSVSPSDKITLTFQQGWCGGVGPTIHYNVPGKFTSYEGAELGTTNDRENGTPIVRFPYITDASVSMVYVQRTVVFQLSSNLKDWTGIKICPLALGYYEPPSSTTGPYVTIIEGGHDYLPFIVTLPEDPPPPDDDPDKPFKPGDPLSVATIEEINIHGMLGSGKPRAEFYRDGEWSPLKKNTTLHIDDKIRTDKDTTVAIEFAIGGRVGLRQNSTITITGERSAKSSTVKKITLEQGGIWAKCDKLKEPMEVQTNGGVMGIKG